MACDDSSCRLFLAFPSIQICKLCDQLERDDQDRLVLCDGPCKQSFHQNCLEMTTEEVDALDEWRCEQCQEGEHTVGGKRLIASLDYHHTWVIIGLVCFSALFVVMKGRITSSGVSISAQSLIVASITTSTASSRCRMQ